MKIFHFLFLIFVLLSGFNLQACDCAITVQTTQSSAYQGTHPLTTAVTDQLINQDPSIRNVISSDNADEIRKIVSNLHDGDILVMAVHSNTEGFALGNDFVEWENFWSTFGRGENIPRLGGVVIQGCMADAIRDAEGNITGYNTIKPKRSEAMRLAFNSTMLITPKGVNPYWTGITDVNTLLQSIYSGKKFGNINFADKWTYLADPLYDKNEINIDDIRKPTIQYLIDDLKELDSLIEGSILGISNWYYGYNDKFRQKLSTIPDEYFSQINQLEFSKKGQKEISAERIRRLAISTDNEDLHESSSLPDYNIGNGSEDDGRNVFEDAKPLNWDGRS